HLSFLDQVLDRSSHLFDWHVRVDAVLIEEIDGVDLESLERALGGRLYVLWPADEAQPLPVGTKLPLKLGAYHHLPTEGHKRFAHELFVYERAVCLGCVEEGDAEVHGLADERDH